MKASICALGIFLGLSACGDDGTGSFPVQRGSQEEYFPLASGQSFLYQVDGDPSQTATMSVQAESTFLRLALEFSDPEQPRLQLLLKLENDIVEVHEVVRGAASLQLEPPLDGLVFELENGLAFSSSTVVEFLASQVGLSLLGVSNNLGVFQGITTNYERTFQVRLNLEADLLRRQRLDLVLAPDLGPVRASLVNPALEELGLNGVELRLDLLEKQP